MQFGIFPDVTIDVGKVFKVKRSVRVQVLGCTERGAMVKIDARTGPLLKSLPKGAWPNSVRGLKQTVVGENGGVEQLG